ncbi:MAG: type 4a pilus biogenesis protein PilO [Azonexus sp.]|jgi:type IV pilus assembly protein PilO|nr:type 4a pilus biogenesis protein PilO [Azonexus sp.]
MKSPEITLPKINFESLAADFRNLNPSDPGAWPAAPKVAILIGLFVVALVIGWLLLWSDQLADLEAKRQAEDGFKQQYLEKKKQAVNINLYREQLEEINRSFGALLKQLPDKSEIDALLIEVNQAGLGRGLQFELFRPGQEQIKDFYAELPVAVKINGNYHDIGAFAADIAKLPRIVTLNNVSIAPVKDALLSLDATIKTFRYLDEAEVAAQKKAAAAAKGAKK